MIRVPASVVRLGRALLLFALVFAMGLGSVGRASCTMHGLGALATHAMPPHSADGSMHGMGLHHKHGSSHDEHSGGCCCTGECSSVAQVATVPVATMVRVAVVLAQPVNVFEPDETDAPPADPDRLLPFANGPPVVASV